MSLLLMLAVVAVVAGIRVAVSPVRPVRVAALAARHRVDLAAADQAHVVGYLAHTRRWRVAGALIGGLVGLVPALPHERITITFFPVLAGWFAGAVAAEFRFPAPAAAGPQAAGAVVPGWVPRVPLLLGTVTAGVTVLVLVLDRAAHGGAVLGWCAGALACCAATWAAGRHVPARPVPAAGHAGRTIAAHAVGTITGAGGALVVWALVNEVAVLDDGFFDAAATAAAGIESVAVLGGLVAARLLATAAWRGAAAGRHPLRPVLLTTAVVVVIGAGWAGYAWWRDHPPYRATAVGATATVRFTSQDRFARDAGAMGVTGLGALADQPGSRQFVGRVDHGMPPGATGRDTYHVLVIDKRHNRVAPELYDATGGGWNSFMSSLADRYSWLSATAPTTGPAGYSLEGSEVSRPADVPGPIEFVGRVPGTAGSATADLMVVLVLSGPDNQIYWADRLAG